MSVSNMPNQTSDAIEIMTAREVTEHLKIGRTKLFELKRNGTLIPGRHFIRNGRFLRFMWGRDLIESIHEHSVEQPAPVRRRSGVSVIDKAGSARKTTLNLNY